MNFDAILKLATEFESLAQFKAPEPQTPSAHAEKELKNREFREKVKTIKLLAETFEKKYIALKYTGFITNFSAMRDLNKAKAYLEDSIKILDSVK